MESFEYRDFKIKPGIPTSFDVKEGGQFGIGKKQYFDVEGRDKNFTIYLLIPDMELIKKERLGNLMKDVFVAEIEKYRLKALKNGIKIAIDELLEEGKLKENRYFWYYEYIDTGQWLRID